MTQSAEPLFPDLRLPTIAAALRGAQPLWTALGVSRVRVFGSVARGEATPGSDIDLLVDWAPGTPRGLLDLMRVREVFEDVLGRRVDVLTAAPLRHPLRGEILEDAVDVLAVPNPAPRTHRPKRWRWRVYDLLAAIDRIAAYTSGHSLTTFTRDEAVRDAVLHNLARLGETTKFIPQSVQDRAPHLPWALLRDIRNLVSHDYFGIEPALIWHTARVELPALRPALQALADGKAGL
ncbi:DUF86 domain-containing protein [Deinococcus sp. HMF7620]|uniref:DUF86 domain-containing protein n=1 Tax=Deinococcus arboris TaxID=2682977 RepID=A0A7C9M7K8_9DEIO|nr:DUF86 domain-containing protein [Deinococcus arboris]